MEIIKYKHRFNGAKLSLLNTKDIDGIALHHMAHNTASIHDVTTWHMDEEFFAWIGYGYWVDKKGKIYECRGMTYVNAAVKKHNNHLISIGCQGDYSQKSTMPEAQIEAIVEVIRYIKAHLPSIRKVAGHKAWNDTSCPGALFPTTEIIRRVEEVVKMEKISTWAKESVDNIVKKGIMKGDPDGNFRPQSPVTREEIAVICNNLLQNLEK